MGVPARLAARLCASLENDSTEELNPFGHPAGFLL